MKYNLALNDNYDLIDSYYIGGLENGGIACENCNRVITNIAEIKNSEGIIFNVGLDCAETLTNLKGLFSVQQEFNEMKGIRAKVNKAKKEGHNVNYSISRYGNLLITSLKFNMQQSFDFSKKYLKDYILQVDNVNKLNYKPYKLENFEVPFIKCMPKDFVGQKYDVKIGDFDVIIEGVLKVNNAMFKITLLLNNNIIIEETFYMYIDIKNRIEWAINDLLFNNYENKNVDNFYLHN